MAKKIETYIKNILKNAYGDNWEQYFNDSPLIQYLNLKSELFMVIQKLGKL